MAREKEKTWLVEGAEDSGPHRAKRKRARGSRADDGNEWLDVPVGGATVQVKDRSGSQGSASRTPSAERRRLTGRLKRATKEIAERDRRIEELQGRVAELERELAQPVSRSARNGSTHENSRRRSHRTAKLGVNEVTFEQLRALGLSVTQSARLIAAREKRGGFASLDELDDLTGFSRETVAELKTQLKRAPARRGTSS